MKGRLSLWLHECIVDAHGSDDSLRHEGVVDGQTSDERIVDAHSSDEGPRHECVVDAHSNHKGSGTSGSWAHTAPTRTAGTRTQEIIQRRTAQEHVAGTVPRKYSRGVVPERKYPGTITTTPTLTLTLTITQTRTQALTLTLTLNSNPNPNNGDHVLVLD